MGKAIRSESAVIITTVTAFIVQLFGLVALFGLQLPEDIRTTIIAIVEPTVLLIFFIGPVIRATVYSQASVEKMAVGGSVVSVDPSTPGV